MPDGTRRAAQTPSAWRPKPARSPPSRASTASAMPSGRVLYVGKAMNLRVAAEQLLPAAAQPARAHPAHGARAPSSVEWTIVASDFEALQLEYTWIKEFDPPFNVKFRDDKCYPFMAITHGRRGPAGDGHAQPPHPRRAVLRPVPEDVGGARDHRPDGQGVPDAHLLRLAATSGRCRAAGRASPARSARCGGPCSQKVTIEEHRAIVEQFAAFMASHDRSVITQARCAR